MKERKKRLPRVKRVRRKKGTLTTEGKPRIWSPAMRRMGTLVEPGEEQSGIVWDQNDRFPWYDGTVQYEPNHWFVPVPKKRIRLKPKRRRLRIRMRLRLADLDD